MPSSIYRGNGSQVLFKRIDLSEESALPASPEFLPLTARRPLRRHLPTAIKTKTLQNR